jgi:UDP-N-acetylmuramyl pentapeptide phosphotransferase/UDP-N-acetylglucosamine-1-phosphate transferase
MLSIFASFIVALGVTMLVVKFAKKITSMLDLDLDGIQKIHAVPVPRIGGLGIFVASVAGCGAVYANSPEVSIAIGLLICSAVPAFGAGIVEDFTKRVRPMKRLMFTMLSAGFAFFALDAAVIRTGNELIDQLLGYTWLALPLTVFAVAGVANAVNIIDGFNGLAGAVTIFMLLSMAYVAHAVGDQFVMGASLIMVGAIAGFFVWNYPHGMIFMGDGGAYFIGFMLGELAVLLVARNPAVSPWYVVLLLIYPLVETIFSIYRRKVIRGVSPGLPDGVHLHMLVFKRMVRWSICSKEARAVTRRNSRTSPYLWLLSLMAVVPATMLWSQTLPLFILSALFAATYVWLYWKIVRFNVPVYLRLKRHRAVHAVRMPIAANEPKMLGETKVSRGR